MRYLRVGPAGRERPVALADGRFYDLSGVTADIDGAFLAGGGIASVAGLPETDVAERRVGPPITRPALGGGGCNSNRPARRPTPGS